MLLELAEGNREDISYMECVFVEVVYAIWLQRNKKLFNGVCEGIESVVNNIIFKVACRCNDKVREFL